jgi:hypothetical protein
MSIGDPYELRLNEDDSFRQVQLKLRFIAPEIFTSARNTQKLRSRTLPNKKLDEI